MYATSTLSTLTYTVTSSTPTSVVHFTNEPWNFTVGEPTEITWIDVQGLVSVELLGFTQAGTNSSEPEYYSTSLGFLVNGLDDSSYYTWTPDSSIPVMEFYQLIISDEVNVGYSDSFQISGVGYPGVG